MMERRHGSDEEVTFDLISEGWDEEVAIQRA